MRIEVVRADPALALPAYAREGDAGLDLVAAETITLPPGGRQLVPTGLNAPGLIDSGYRGEVGVLLVNHGALAVTIGRGERIAQLVIQAVGRATLVEVRELPSSRRGDGGFGSTGA